MVRDIVAAALEKKALGPVALNVSGKASYTDFIVLMSGRSDRQVRAIAEHVNTVMKQQGQYAIGREGNDGGAGRCWTTGLSSSTSSTTRFGIFTTLRGCGSTRTDWSWTCRPRPSCRRLICFTAPRAR